MSNSIWHKASEKPELNKHVVVRKHGFAQWKVFKFDNKTTFYEPFTDDLWAYVAYIIAQADKAERLEKENEAMREEFEVWHENYKCEVEDKERLQKGLEDIKNQLEYRACLECKHCNQQLNAIEILKDVEQLIKGE